MDKNIQKFKIMSFSTKDLPNYGEICLVEATGSVNGFVQTFLDEDCITDKFRMAKSGSLAEEARQAYEENKLWLVDMSKFQNKDDIPDVNGNVGIRRAHDELVEMSEEEFNKMLEKTLREMDQSDLKSMIDKAIKNSVLKQMGLEGLDNWKTFVAHVTTMKDGYVYMNHNLDSLIADDEDDAYNVMLSVISSREGRSVLPSDILSCIILPKGDKLFNFDKN